jgi:3-oxoacyl-[acyl-carrier protein] reductase
MPRPSSRPVALLAGATGTLGGAIALRLAQEGFDLVLGYRTRAGEGRLLAERCRRRGIRALAIRSDLAARGGPAKLVARARKTFGRLDAVVCAVGGIESGRAESLDGSTLRSLLESNVEGPFALARAALPVFPKARGRIVFFGQTGASDLSPRRKTAGYTAAKAALLLLARSLAREVAPRGITVNLVSPGAVAGSRGPRLPLRLVPSGRWPTAEEVAAAVAYLLSPEARSVTGADIPVSGGFGI